ncbi:unnamed protein product [Sphenostylis stenocarpa]|uniref:Fe2OG dioxygenase domain-containing protein n=1 Tax=Sphenostylis stenocarpa TaxID=92480 RepID=A0AA86VLP7_9FABA|nr:unnamed protein product [Sphenostylis stenocarpa]
MRFSIGRIHWYILVLLLGKTLSFGLRNLPTTGLEARYFCGALTQNPSLLAHHYPPCPDPTLTLGVARHKDPTIITILLQDKEVEGLQVLKDGEWVCVDPIPNAFVVNIGLLLQVTH